MTHCDDESSLPYWDQRWGAAPEDFATSWPDQYARTLELLFVHRSLPPIGKQIVELGCGAFGLTESAELAQALEARRYIGVDGCEAALKVARRRAAGFPHAAFAQLDLSSGPPNLTGDFVLTKRTIQNLSPDAREWVWDYLAGFEHGLLLEDLSEARASTDEQRAFFNRPPLVIPEFNWPIEPWELARLDAKRTTRIVPFMGWFYSITRVFPDLPAEGHAAAFKLSARAIQQGATQPLSGPVVAVVW